MNWQDRIFEMGRTYFDFLVRYLDFFENEPFARVLALIIVLSVAIAVILLLHRTWIIARKGFSTLGQAATTPEPTDANAFVLDDGELGGATPKSTWIDQSAPPAGKGIEWNSMANSIESLSNEIQGIRASFEDALGGLAKERKDRAVQAVESLRKIHIAMSKIDGAINGIVVKINKSRAQMAVFEERFESLHTTVDDLGKHLVNGRRGQSVGFAINLPPEKFSTEIADIVDKLKEA